MEFFNSLNLTQIKGGTKLKQGDLGSVLSYSLTDENGQEITSFDTKTAYINLVLDDKIWFTTTTLVDISRVTFRIDKAIPIGLYYLEIKIDDYIFPSDRDSIILIEEGSTPYDLKELVPNYDINMTIKGILSDLSQKGIDISDLRTKLDEIDDKHTTQLKKKIGGGVKAEPEDLSAKTLGLVTGTGGPINLLSIPQDDSVTRAKLDATLESEIDLLFPPDPNKNAMAPINSAQKTVSWFNDCGNPENATYSEPIVGGIKEYHIDTTSDFTQLQKPYVTLNGAKGIAFDIKPSTTYEFRCDVGRATARGVFTLLMENGTNVLDTQYCTFKAGATSATTTFTTPAGANKFEISLFGFDENITGEHHLKISNLSLKTVIPQDPDIIARTGALETTVTEIDDRVSNLENVLTKSYFILDFDYSPQSWDDLNIKTVLDEFGYPFKFNFGPTTNADIAWALVRRGCEMSTYYNDGAFLPTDEQLNSTEPTDIAKVDAYVKQALTVQYELNYRDQLTWSTRQFKTGVALENALKKYGYSIQRLRALKTLLPTSMGRNKLTKFYVSDNTTNWYQHTLEGIDLAIANGGSLAIFTHKLVPADDASGINIMDSQYRLILNKIKGYVDAGQAEVITYRDYFEKFSN